MINIKIMALGSLMVFLPAIRRGSGMQLNGYLAFIILFMAIASAGVSMLNKKLSDK